MRIAVVNGPNLNLLGSREPERYGRTTLGEIETRLHALGRELGADIECSQHNCEGALVDVVQRMAGRVDGALVNAGAYTHTSLALRDAFTAVQVPFVEVHLTNVHAREPERRHSMLAPAALAVVAGFGPASYEVALRGIVSALTSRG